MNARAQSRITAELFMRELGRIAHGRIIVAGVLLALLFLVLDGAFVLEATYSYPSANGVRAAALRTEGFERTLGYDTILLVFSAILGLTRIEGDLRTGVALSVLAMPIGRAQYYVASWSASCVLLTILEACRSVPILLASACIEGRWDATALFGVVAVCLGHCVNAALFFALSAALSPPYAAVIGLSVLAIGGRAFGAGVSTVPGVLSDAAGTVVPLLTQQRPTIMAAVKGSLAHGSEIAETMAYRCAWSWLLVTVGAMLFSRRELARRRE